MPEVTPVTTPEVEPTVATAELLVIHVPPDGEPVNVVDDPMQTLELPEIVAEELTVTDLVAVHPPAV